MAIGGGLAGGVSAAALEAAKATIIKSAASVSAGAVAALLTYWAAQCEMECGATECGVDISVLGGN
jgi:hypothetical protein